MAYDADCGPCTRFRHFVHLIDRRGEVDFVSLVDADDSGLLDKLPEIERHTAFHVILPNGKLLTGAEAVPPLLQLLPGGRVFSKLITSSPEGRLVVSIVYEGFARGHNGSACRYPRPVAGPQLRRSTPASTEPAVRRRSRSAYVFAGMIGGLLGSLAMGLSVHVPDALCVWLATVLVGRAWGAIPLAWGLHFLTALLIGSAFGGVASVLPDRAVGSPARGLLFGLVSGLIVWAAFFLPLMGTILPQLVTGGLVESSFFAHVLLGLVLGFALVGMRRVTSRPPAR